MTTRRDVLKGLSLGAAGALLSPVLRQVQAQADGAPPPARFIFLLESNGRAPKHIQPTGIAWPDGAWHTANEKLIDAPLTEANALHPSLAPLAPYKDRVTVIQGLSGVVARGGGHSSNFGALGCYAGAKAGDSNILGGAYGETIDAALGKARPALFPQLPLGIVRDPKPSMVYNSSATGVDKPVATICHPDLAYSSIFGSVAEGAAGQQFIAEKNLLDFMAGAIKRSEPRLAGPERDKFQHHLAAYESLRDQKSRLNEIEHTLRKHAPVFGNKYTSTVESDRLDAQFDLGAACLIGGLTNVLTIASGTGGAHMSIAFHGLGIDVAKHELGHGTKDDGRDADLCLDIIRGFHLELLARLMKKLDAVPEGDGTMLDNTLIVYMSDAAEGHHPNYQQWPVVLVGNLGGRLKAGGRFLGYPKYRGEGHRTMGNLFLTLLHAVGDRREQFGTEDINLRDIDARGPLAELLG